MSDAIAAGGRPVTEMISETWTADDLVDGLLSGDATLAAVNAHFDHNRAEPADASAGLFTTGDVVDSGPATLSQAVIFSMGCHSGLSVSDIQIGGDPLGVDWPQTMAAQGAAHVGNTGFGYGETETVALSEQLMAYFAEGVDGGVTVGRALQLAKHRYAGSDLLFGGYDDKVLMISTFYGLPFFRVGGDGTIPPPPAAPPLSVDGVTGSVGGRDRHRPAGRRRADQGSTPIGARTSPPTPGRACRRPRSPRSGRSSPGSRSTSPRVAGWSPTGPSSPG